MVERLHDFVINLASSVCNTEERTERKHSVFVAEKKKRREIDEGFVRAS